MPMESKEQVLRRRPSSMPRFFGGHRRRSWGEMRSAEFAEVGVRCESISHTYIYKHIHKGYVHFLGFLPGISMYRTHSYS